MKYTLMVIRKVKDVGFVDIEANDWKDAIRKYWNPEPSKGEDIIFDDEVRWDDSATKYDYDVVICDREEE